MAEQFLTAVVPRFLSLTAVPQAVAVVSLRLERARWGAVYEVQHPQQGEVLKLWLGVKGTRACVVFFFPSVAADESTFESWFGPCIEGMRRWSSRWQHDTGVVSLHMTLDSEAPLLTSPNSRVHLTQDIGMLAACLFVNGQRTGALPWTVPDPHPGGNPWSSTS